MVYHLPNLLECGFTSSPLVSSVVRPRFSRSTPQKFVVCLDTMGQDREFTNDQRRFVLETVLAFKKAWEQSEVRVMDNDVEIMMEL